MARRITPSGLMQITRNSTNKIRLTIAVIVVPGIRVSYSVLILGGLAFFAAAVCFAAFWEAVFFFAAGDVFACCFVFFCAIK